VFARNGTSWTEEARLTLTGQDPGGDQFGASVALVGNQLFVGAPGDTHAGGVNAGSAYMFVHSGSEWIETLEFTASDATDGDVFGTSVAVSGHVVVIGAEHDGLGSAYVFRLCSQPVTWLTYCTAGISSSGCQATLSACGSASASAVTGFDLIASNVEGASDGLFYFGSSGQQANLWGNGTSFQCVVPPVTRAGLQKQTGTNGVCDGSFLQDLNAFWCPSCPKPGKNPGAGASVQAQLWYRDLLSTSNQTTSLSDAIEFVVAP
jgi:hypothetical protein